MPNQHIFAYHSFIKNIYLKLPKPYKYNHQSLTADGDLFLGREKNLSLFVDILDNGSNRGAYLVTGYRGMGKTSFVNRALEKLEELEAKKKEKEKKKETDVNAKSKVFRLSLAQSELKDTDILKHIVNKLLSEVELKDDYLVARRFSLNNIFSWVWPLATSIIILCSYSLIVTNSDNPKSIIENLLGIVSFSALVTLFVYKIIGWTYGKISQSRDWIRELLYFFSIVYFIVIVALLSILPLFYELTLSKLYIPLYILIVFTFLFALIIELLTNIFKKKDYVPIKEVYEKLSLLHKRCNAQITSEDQFRETFSSSVSSLFKKDVMIYPIANPREIESELIDIISDLKSHFRCIFVFDELDKVDTNFDLLPSGSSDTPLDKRTYLNDLRERRHLITHILGSLKFFINEAEAKFIFIAGREMFEAALADISDRQSSISSIFHRVIYVDSFLKDQSEGETITSSIGVLVEKILGNLLLHPEDVPVSDKLKRREFFTTYYNQLLIEGRLDEIAARKIIFVLQNFLGYLVYRSNGSPKKVVKLLEEYITLAKIDEEKLTNSQNIIFEKQGEVQENSSPEHYLRFSYLDQYKLGFTAYLFQPFLTMYSSFMKRYSDNTLVSTPYLIDNLIKFHPFAFSAQNLELIPEILSTNKSPISRPFLEELITFLGQNHIRRTDSGLFEYKFYDRTHNEITYISKLFEDEAAAFNFTLDENFSVKAHLISKIKQLRIAHYTDGGKVSDGENPIGSIIFLNRLLGDVRFQDEEYEDAIVSYQDAIQMIAYDRLSLSHNYITFVRIKLKLGLAYEKIKAHEFALGHYAGVVEEGADFMKIHAKKHDIIYRELLLLVMQAYSATLYLQEKLQEGITFQKIKNTVRSFHTLLGKYPQNHYDRDILLATFYSNIGTALYYKNMVLPQKVNEIRVKAAKLSAGEELKAVIEAEDQATDLQKEIIKKYDQTVGEATKATLSCFPAAIDTHFLTVSSNELRAISNPKHIHSDARISFTSYVYYKLTLKILLGCDKPNLIDLLKSCPKLIRVNTGEASYRSLQHIRRLTSIGHALAKLGDLLLPLTQMDNVIVTEVLGCFYREGTFLLESESRHELLHSYFEKLSNQEGSPYNELNEKIHPRLIVNIYYLASMFYIEAAETANSAFQLRKILFTLRSLDLVVNPDANIQPGQKSLSVNGALKSLEFNLVKRILELSSWMSHSSDRPQLSKTKKYFGINTLRTPHADSSELYGNLSNNPDTKETVLAYALLKTQYQSYPDDPTTKLMDCYKTSLEHKLVSPYGSIAHHIIRIMELELHTNMNYKIVKTRCRKGLSIIVDKVFPNQEQFFQSRKLNIPYTPFTSTIKKDRIKLFLAKLIPFALVGKTNSWESKYVHACTLYDIQENDFRKPPTKLQEKEFSDILNQFDAYFKTDDEPLKATRKQELETWVFDYSELILNSVFNLSQIDRIINTYGVNYILSYSYMAKTHEHLGTWLKHLHLCRILNNRYELGITIDHTLQELVGPQLSTTFDPLTSYQVALQFYYQAIQLHKEGDAYRHQINNFVYLEDDYNDNLYHFGAALERLLINSGSIRQKIDFLKRELGTASMYKYSTYVGEETASVTNP